MLETELKELALREGGIRTGIARKEAFSEAPQSADMRYLQPWANSVLSFAVTTGTDWIEDYLGKVIFPPIIVLSSLLQILHIMYRA